MSNLKERAREVKEEGERQRGNFEPTGAPKNAYNYWLKHTTTKKGRDIRDGLRRENFCHFWRVVAIWFPFMFAKNKVVDYGAYVMLTVSIVAVLGLIASAASFSIVAAIIGWTLAVGFGFALACVGLCSGIALTLGPAVAADYSLPSGKWAWIGAVLAAPAAIIGAFTTKTVQWYMRNKSAINPILGKIGIVLGLTAVVAAVVMISVMAVVDFGFWTSVLYLLGLLALVAVFFGICGLIAGGMEHLGRYIQAKRALAKKRASAARAEYYEEHGEYEYETRARKGPGKIARFFIGVADFIVLYSQVARVNKWKICPLVDVDTDDKK